MKAEADVGVGWWVWLCGCCVVGVGIGWVCEVGLATVVWWQRHSVGSSKISSSHPAFWQLHSRRGQQQSLSPLTVFFFFFWKASHSLCLASALGFPFGRVIPSRVSFFPFVFPFGLRRLESSVRLLGFFFFWKLTYLDLFIYLFFTSGLAGWVTILEELKLFVRG